MSPNSVSKLQLKYSCFSFQPPLPSQYYLITKSSLNQEQEQAEAPHCQLWSYHTVWNSLLSRVIFVDRSYQVLMSFKIIMTSQTTLYLRFSVMLLSRSGISWSLHWVARPAPTDTDPGSGHPILSRCTIADADHHNHRVLFIEKCWQVIKCVHNPMYFAKLRTKQQYSVTDRKFSLLWCPQVGPPQQYSVNFGPGREKEI